MILTPILKTSELLEVNTISTLQGLYFGFNFDPNNRSFHPFVNIIIVMLLFVLGISLPFSFLMVLLSFILLEIILIKRVKNSFLLIKGIFPLLFMVTIFSLLFAGPERTFTIVLRLIIGALIFSIFFTTTNPAELSKFLEKLKLPHKYAIIPALSIALLPKAAKDANEAYETLLFRGEIKGSFFRWMPRTLSILIASSLYRAKFIAESLYIRNFGNPDRKVYLDRKLSFHDFFKLIGWSLGFIIIFQVQS